MQIKTRRKKTSKDIELFRQELLAAIDVMNPCNELELDGRNGSVVVSGDLVYPKEVVHYSDLARLIDKRDYYNAMSEDAKTSINFVCVSEWELVLQTCGTKISKKVTAHGVGMFFRKKWGRKRVSVAIREIKKLLAI